MKKLIVVLSMLSIVTMTSCQQTKQSNTDEIKKNLIYFKDSNTNLCFGAINSFSAQGYEVTSITCVPCDSLKNISVLK